MHWQCLNKDIKTEAGRRTGPEGEECQRATGGLSGSGYFFPSKKVSSALDCLSLAPVGESNIISHLPPPCLHPSKGLHPIV